MVQNNFRRVEKKYLLDENTYHKLMDVIEPYLEHDEYFKSSIYNIYFDTKDNDLIIKSLQKPTFKEKVRLRSYGVPTLDDMVFFELKYKYKGVIGKRRVRMKLSDFYLYLNGKYKPNSQIMKEIDYVFKYYDLKPAIYIGYDRLSYKGLSKEYLRITFDSNLRSRREDLKLESNKKGKKLFSENKYIMEIKTLGSMPKWLVDALSKLKIYPSSFSKYGEIYKQELKEMKTLC